MNKRTKHILAALLTGGALILSTWGTAATAQDNAAPAQTAPAEAKPETISKAEFKELPDDATAVEINGVKVPMKEINEAVATIKERDARLADDSAESKERLAELQQSMLNDIIDFQLLLQEAEKRGIKPDEKRLDAQMWQIRGRFPNADSYNKWLESGKQTEESLRKNAAESMVVEELGSQLSVDITVNDADLQKFYDAHKDNLKIPDSVRVSHILIAVKPDADDKAKKEAETKAKNILKQALSSKTSFGDLAKENSDDKATIENGGDLGNLVHVEDGNWKPIVDAAFAGTPGKVNSELVKSAFGYHIVKPITKNPGRTLTLDEVRDEIKPAVLHEKVEERIQEEIEKLRKSATIKKHL